MTIRKLASELGIPQSTLQLWVAKGLIQSKPGRGRAGYEITARGIKTAMRLTAVRAQIRELEKAFEVRQ